MAAGIFASFARRAASQRCQSASSLVSNRMSALVDALDDAEEALKGEPYEVRLAAAKEILVRTPQTGPDAPAAKRAARPKRKGRNG